MALSLPSRPDDKGPAARGPGLGGRGALQPFEVGMRPIGKTLVALLCGAVVWLGWTEFARSTGEVVTLHVSSAQNKDYFPRLWVVDARRYLWIRAERPDRRWLSALRERPRVMLSRGGRSARYEAAVWERSDVSRDVDALFREKYGLADLVRERLFERRTIPIRLTPR